MAPSLTAFNALLEEDYMQTVLITGSRGFIGKNLLAHLAEMNEVRVLAAHWDDSEDIWKDLVSQADKIVHLAGVNRPDDPEEFEKGNVDLTRKICTFAAATICRPHIIMSSSIQARLDNAYGASKKKAEEELKKYSAEANAKVSIIRLKNVFGKWCRPNYNSVVATFCHNIACDKPIEIRDPTFELELVHVDDVVKTILEELKSTDPKEQVVERGNEMPSPQITLGELAGRIQEFRDMGNSLLIPDLSDSFVQQLYSTFLSYVDPSKWEYGLQKREDNRGSLAEFVKSDGFGQIFVSRTKPGITRGNHYHHVKTEKFLVLSGQGLIRLRHINDTKVIEYLVRGDEYRVVDIPPGYTHSIENVGDTEMVTLFWANEIFDPNQPDTYFQNVEVSEGEQPNTLRKAS